MKWSDLSTTCRTYLVCVYLVAIPFAFLCFRSVGTYPLVWLILTLIAACVATVNVRLPRISSVISMGDVFTILALAQFGVGPALATYWMSNIAAVVADQIR